MVNMEKLILAHITDCYNVELNKMSFIKKYIKEHNLFVQVEDYDENLTNIITNLLIYDKIPFLGDYSDYDNVCPIIHYYMAIYYFVKQKYDLVLIHLHYSSKKQYWQAFSAYGCMYSKGTLYDCSNYFVPSIHEQIWELDFDFALKNMIITYNMTNNLEYQLFAHQIIKNHNVSWCPQFNDSFACVFWPSTSMGFINGLLVVKNEYVHVSFIDESHNILLVFKYKRITRQLAYLCIAKLYNRWKKYVQFMNALEKSKHVMCD